MAPFTQNGLSPDAGETLTREKPLCSIITAAYNSAGTIEKTIKSVINQTEPSWELIVIDDGSTDTTASLVKKLSQKDKRIRFLQNECNRGVAETRNRGLKEARGSYIAFLDSDDWWQPEKLQKQIAFMRENCCHISCTGFHRVDFEGTRMLRTVIPPERMNLSDLYKKNDIGFSTSMVESSLAKTVCFESGELLEDFIYWLELLKKGQEALSLQQALVFYRSAPASRSSNKLKMASARWKVLRRREKLPLYKTIPCFLYYIYASVCKR